MEPRSSKETLGPRDETRRGETRRDVSRQKFIKVRTLRASGPDVTGWQLLLRPTAAKTSNLSRFRKMFKPTVFWRWPATKVDIHDVFRKSLNVSSFSIRGGPKGTRGLQSSKRPAPSIKRGLSGPFLRGAQNGTPELERDPGVPRRDETRRDEARRDETYRVFGKY